MQVAMMNIWKSALNQAFLLLDWGGPVGSRMASQSLEFTAQETT